MIRFKHDGGAILYDRKIGGVSIKAVQKARGIRVSIRDPEDSRHNRDSRLMDEKRARFYAYTGYVLGKLHVARRLLAKLDRQKSKAV